MSRTQNDHILCTASVRDFRHTPVKYLKLHTRAHFKKCLPDIPLTSIFTKKGSMTAHGISAAPLEGHLPRTLSKTTHFRENAFLHKYRTGLRFAKRVRVWRCLLPRRTNAAAMRAKLIRNSGFARGVCLFAYEVLTSAERAPRGARSQSFNFGGARIHFPVARAAIYINI